MEPVKSMTQNSPLIIDWTQKNIDSQLFPGSSLLSSHKAGWQNITLEHHFVDSVWETPNIEYAQHTIVIHLNNKTAFFQIKKLLPLKINYGTQSTK